MFLVRSTKQFPCGHPLSQCRIHVCRRVGNYVFLCGTIYTPKAFFTFPILDAATPEFAGDEAACAPSTCALQAGISKSAISDQAGDEEVYQRGGPFAVTFVSTLAVNIHLAMMTLGVKRLCDIWFVRAGYDGFSPRKHHSQPAIVRERARISKIEPPLSCCSIFDEACERPFKRRHQ